MRLVLLIALAAAVAGCDIAPTATQMSAYDFRATGPVGVGRTRGDTGVITDRETGCEYIVTAWREVAITPRLDATGHPICGHTKT